MSNEIIVTESNYIDVLEEINSAFFDVPFENSQFQTENFVIAGQVTPARAYRSIGLRMHSRLAALREAQYSRAKEDIDIEELQEKIADPKTSDFDRRRAQLDINYKLASRPYADKLINDALKELNVLYAHFKALPKYTREEFEAEERTHFQHKLGRQIQNIQGAHEALTNMNADFQAIQKIEQQYKLLTEK